MIGNGGHLDRPVESMASLPFLICEEHEHPYAKAAAWQPGGSQGQQS